LQTRLVDIRLAASEESAALSTALDEALQAGFDGVVCGDARSPGDVERFAAAALAKGLGPWLVIAPDRDGEPSFDVVDSTRVDPWMVVDDDALDPRHSPRRTRQTRLVLDEAHATRWHEALERALGSGCTGLVCRDPDRLPPGFWALALERLRPRYPQVVWFAWTAGLAPERIDALVDAGFDGVTSSVAWWDGSSAWLAAESLRQSRAHQLAFPVDPFDADGARTTNANPNLWAAAVAGDVLLVPRAWLSDARATSVTAVNRWRAIAGDAAGPVLMLTGPGNTVTAIARGDAPDLRAATHVRVALINTDVRRAATLQAARITARLGAFGRPRVLAAQGGRDDRFALEACDTVRLDAGECVLIELERLPMIALDVPRSKRSAKEALAWPRIAIEAITPTVEHGRFPVKRIAGETVRVEADILIDGHEMLAAAVLYRAVGDKRWQEVSMEAIGNDRYAATFPLTRIGRHEFTIEAWRDVFASYRYEIDKKFAAGLDVSLELAEGRLLVAAAAERVGRNTDLGRRLAMLRKSLDVVSVDVVPRVDRDTMAAQVGTLLASQTRDDLRAADARTFAVRPERTFTIDAERSEAAFASWYELFPRSQGNVPGRPTRHGSFDDVIDRLPAVRAMGFDVLYFPPIHPIGRRNRKGPNNSLVANEGDPGSPYAIGAAEGGHDALHPELGTFDDFKRLRDAALDQGLELALDFAIQCSPDHPWLQEHPGWFAWRPDGSLRYAENPPKKYEDIVNVDFYGHGDTDEAEAAALWIALRDVILSWVDQGVKIFRVDNPHTKSLPFWEWVIGEVRARHPDAMFLSEAFTRPKVMYRLAKIGFSQSYTYFTWRHTKQEFIDYLTELTASPNPATDPQSAPRDFFRPNFFVNTPDINPYFLQRSGRPGFLIRAALAGTLSGLWGVYSGFELCEATPVPGKEEYLDSEKYEVRPWDWKRPGNIIAEITQLNRIRRENPALQTHLNVRFETVFDPNILYFAKETDDRSNVVLVAINLDPHGVHEADFEVPLWRWGLADDASVRVTDLLDEHAFAWRGKYQRMRLDPQHNPYAIWRVSL